MDKEKIEVTSTEQSSKGERIKKMKRGKEDDQGSDGEEFNPVIPTQLDQPRRRWSSWKFPPSFYRKLNVCGGPSSYGYCIRDSAGMLAEAGVKWERPEAVFGRSKEYMEAEALHYGLQKSLRFSYKKLIAECSCLPLVTKINDRMMIQELGMGIPEVVTKILELQSRFDSLNFSYVKPDGNFVAYQMSNLTVNGWEAGCEVTWLTNFPNFAYDPASWDIGCCVINEMESEEKEATKVELPAPSMSSRTGEASFPDEHTAESQKNQGAASIASPESDTIYK